MVVTNQIVCKDLDSCSVIPGATVNRIMVPFDNSKHAARAFSFALTLSKIFNASLFVISITKEEISRNWVNDTPTREKSMTKGNTDIPEEGISQLKIQAKKFGVKFDSAIISSNHVDETLLSLASERKIDLIVMGTRGKGMPKEMMLGRVSTSVALNSACPVVLTK